MTRNERIAYYRDHIYHRVEGWLGNRMWEIISAIGGYFETTGVHGDIVEFGVHQGKFLSLIDALREHGEHTRAVDIFGAQHLNVDLSGYGDLERLCSNLELLPWWENRTGISTHQCDTLSISHWTMRGICPDGAKFFSIDAGHTPLHAFNDLVLAQEVLVPGGVIALDDYFNPRWPGATEGFYDFMHRANRRLRPLVFFQRKLYITTASEHSSMQDYLYEMLGGDTTSIAGCDCLTLSWDGY